MLRFGLAGLIALNVIDEVTDCLKLSDYEHSSAEFLLFLFYSYYKKEIYFYLLYDLYELESLLPAIFTDDGISAILFLELICWEFDKWEDGGVVENFF